MNISYIFFIDTEQAVPLYGAVHPLCSSIANNQIL